MALAYRTDEFVRDPGRGPTDDELEVITGFSASYVMPALPSRSKYKDIDEPERLLIAGSNPATIEDGVATGRMQISYSKFSTRCWLTST